MIRIARDRLDEQGVPIRPGGAWFELAATTTQTALAEGAAHRALEEVYAHPQVRLALEKLFYDKCAYCEGSSLGQADWNVEHFRPKARVAERDDHPGYYWLVYRWENLYPSCSHCNQKRKDRPRWGDTSLSAGPARGKLDQFPLADEQTRAMAPLNDPGAEHALLLDPCRDEPEEHIRFDVHGSPLPVAGSVRGEVSIDVFHLKRKRLRDQRKGHIENVVRLMSVIRSLENQLGAGHPAVAEVREALTKTYLLERTQFAAVGRWVLRDPVSFGLEP